MKFWISLAVSFGLGIILTLLWLSAMASVGAGAAYDAAMIGAIFGAMDTATKRPDWYNNY